MEQRMINRSSLGMLFLALCFIFLAACTGDDGPPAASPSPSASVPPGAQDLDEDGYATEDGDCDDLDRHTYPGAEEVPYDGIDQDCSGADRTDVDGDGFDAEAAEGDDCLDNDPDSYPGAVEVGDHQDNDCDGEVDEGLDDSDRDGDGFSEQDGDCDDDNPDRNPDAEDIPYDGIDQDCSGADLTDVDGDGYAGGTMGSDCDDSDTSIHPGAVEVAYDGIDQDCSGADLDDQDDDVSPVAPMARIAMTRILPGVPVWPKFLMTGSIRTVRARTSPTWTVMDTRPSRRVDRKGRSSIVMTTTVIPIRAQRRCPTTGSIRIAPARI